MILSLFMVASCSKSHTPFTEIDEPSYAAETLENMLLARNNNDYDTYIGYYHPIMEEFITEEVFGQSVAFTKNTFGDYIANSKQFSDASFQYDNLHGMGFTVVDYYAKFTNNPAEDVLVEIVFREIDGDIFVEDLSVGSRGIYYYPTD